MGIVALSKSKALGIYPGHGSRYAPPSGPGQYTGRNAGSSSFGLQVESSTHCLGRRYEQHVCTYLNVNPV